MPSTIDVLKEIEPSEVAGQILANPKIQMLIGGAMTGGGTAVVNADLAFRSDVMFYLGAATFVMGLLVSVSILVRNMIGINNDLKDSAKN